MCRPKNQPSPTTPPRSAASAFYPCRPAAGRLARTLSCASCSCTPPLSLSCFLSFSLAPVRCHLCRAFLFVLPCQPARLPLSTSGIVETTGAALSFGPRCKTWTYFKFAAFYRIRYLSTGCTSKGRLLYLPSVLSRPPTDFSRPGVVGRAETFSRYLSAVSRRRSRSPADHSAPHHAASSRNAPARRRRDAPSAMCTSRRSRSNRRIVALRALSLATPLSLALATVRRIFSRSTARFVYAISFFPSPRDAFARAFLINIFRKNYRSHGAKSMYV